MKAAALAPALALLLAGAGCGDSTPGHADAGTDAAVADASTTASDGGPDAAALSLATCTTQVAAGAPDFFKKYFRCVSITTSGSTVTIASPGLPPHPTYYYGVGNPNYAPFDTTRGPEYHPNPNLIAARPFQVAIPLVPVAKGLTVTAAMVDGVVGTSSDEYPLGPAGVALDSVAMFNPLAAPGDNIDNEKYTFDDYDAHPTNDGTYHYHSTSKGPLAVTGGAPELFGIMCDGTVVLGCSELDGSAPSSADFDAQHGHVHDLKDAAGALLLAGRYHVHVCPSDPSGRKYTPEIQYYTTCTR